MKTGRFIGALMASILFVTALFCGVYYFFIKQTINWIVIAVLFGIPLAIFVLFFIKISSGAETNKFIELAKQVNGIFKSETNQSTQVTPNE